MLAASRDGLALREVSARLRAPKSSLLPLLRALTARGYLAQGRALEYRLGPGALDLGAAAPAHRDLIEVARPAVVDLMRRTGETVFLGTLCSDRASIVYVDKVESDHVIRYAGGVGDRRPLHATSSGKVILAFCVTTDELVSGASGIAAPVFDRYGRVAGACAIGGPTDRVGPRTRALAVEVTATARILSAGLGHRPRDGKESGGRTR